MISPMSTNKENESWPPVTPEEVVFLSKEDPESSFYAISLLADIRIGYKTIDQKAHELSRLEDDEDLTHKAALIKALNILRDNAEKLGLKISKEE